MQCLVYLVVSSYLAIIWGSLLFTPTTITIYIAIYAAGAVIFAVGYYNAKRKGIPIELVFKQISPE